MLFDALKIGKVHIREVTNVEIKYASSEVGILKDLLLESKKRLWVL